MGKRKRRRGESRAWQRDRRSLNPLTLTSPRAGATAARSQHVRPRAALHRRPSFLPPPAVAVAMRCRPSSPAQPLKPAVRIQGAHGTRGESSSLSRGNITPRRGNTPPRSRHTDVARATWSATPANTGGFCKNQRGWKNRGRKGRGKKMKNATVNGGAGVAGTGGREERER